jgi:DNA-binding transcriptional MerR regulator
MHGPGVGLLERLQDELLDRDVRRAVGPQVVGQTEAALDRELAERSGVATTALRYYDELGLVRPATRSSGRRRYAESAVAEVGAILFFREVGFSLAEISPFLTACDRRSHQEIGDRKPAELTEKQHRINVARERRSRTVSDAPPATPCAARDSGRSSTDSYAGSHWRRATRECTDADRHIRSPRVGRGEALSILPVGRATTGFAGFAWGGLVARAPP